ncbi:PulJ/GspJ family protein [Tumebacillus lipolyticus]|uniref:Type II secretion system protein J n=1 Tax=Tumebacillus lipolyticus TaxID=1280370 RepID=A0ABW4ZT32_9BACL
MRKRGRRYIFDQRGTTLLELVIALSVAGMLLPLIAAWLIALTAQWQQMAERMETRQQTTIALHRIGADVRSGGDFLQLSNGLALHDGEGRTIRYQLSSAGNLLREEVGGGSTVLATAITICRFDLEQGGRILSITLDDVRQTWWGRRSAL